MTSTLDCRPNIVEADSAPVAPTTPAVEPASPAEPDEFADDELTMEDLRPSQPEAPAGTSDYAHGWGMSDPIISSVDGVEVDPPTAPEQRRPDEAADDSSGS